MAKLSAAATAVRGRNFEPNVAVLTPSVLDTLRLTADSTGQFLIPPTTLTNVNMESTSAMVSTMAMVGDFSKCVWGIRKAASIEVSNSANTSFNKHAVLVKVVFRGDFAPLYTGAFHRLEGIS